MATEAYGQDFWVGRILISKDTRELWRHVIIADILHARGGAKAKCHNLLIPAEGEKVKMWKRGSMISLKSLAKRWRHCPNKECFCKSVNKQEPDAPTPAL